MRKHDWKRNRKPYNPLYYKGLHREKPVSQPHSKACRCKACVAYLGLLLKLNPERHHKLTEVSDGLFVRPKVNPESIMRERRAYSIGSWRG